MRQRQLVQGDHLTELQALGADLAEASGLGSRALILKV